MEHRTLWTVPRGDRSSRLGPVATSSRRVSTKGENKMTAECARYALEKAEAALDAVHEANSERLTHGPLHEAACKLRIVIAHLRDAAESVPSDVESRIERLEQARIERLERAEALFARVASLE